MKRDKIAKRRIASAICSVCTAFLTAVNAFAAGNIANSNVAVGVNNLLNDITTWLLVIAPSVGALVIVYFCIRRSGADEMDQKKWNNRITTAAISTIAAVLAVSLLNLVLGYFTTPTTTV